MNRLPTMPRDAGLDLLKWLAMLSMLLDHLRYVGVSADALYIPGRMAFPWFCLAIALNLARIRSTAEPRGIPWRYLAGLLLFSAVAELPYRLFMPETDTLNVLPTLALGLLVAQGWRERSAGALALAGSALLIAALFPTALMFGFYGVLLPLTLLLVLRGPWYSALLPGLVCLAGNEWPELVAGARWGNPIAMAGIAACVLGPLIGLAIIRSCPVVAIWPMRRWAYALYPLHFLLLLVIRSTIQW